MLDYKQTRDFLPLHSSNSSTGFRLNGTYGLNSPLWPLKVGSHQNLKNRMDVGRKFYLEKKNILATIFECMMRQFHENLNWKFRVMEGSETDSGSKWNRKGKYR